MRSEEDERSDNAGVLAHTYMVKQMPNEGIASCAGEWINQGWKSDIKRVKYKMSRSSGRSSS